MGTVTRPAAQDAKSSSVHSYVVRAMIAIRSPPRRPSAIRPLATARTSAANSVAVTSCQLPSGCLRLSTASEGASRALSNGISASEPRRTGGANAGTETCWTLPSAALTFVGSTRTGAEGAGEGAGGVDTCGSSTSGSCGSPGADDGRRWGLGRTVLDFAAVHTRSRIAVTP